VSPPYLYMYVDSY